nr:caffeic acid 3-O-methyltransferase-like [Ipomoea batatas]GME17018.1 caffeic acid 3-O-methyltransferase-like [Ipomoea batatas]
MLDFALGTSATMISGEEDEGFLKAIGVTSGIPLMMVLRASIELGVFETIAKAGEEAKLSAKEIAASLPTQNPNAPNMIDRMLKFLASHSILSCTITEVKNGSGAQCLYGLAPVCKHFVSNEDGVSLSPMVQLMTDRAFMDSWYSFFSSL